MIEENDGFCNSKYNKYNKFPHNTNSSIYIQNEFSVLVLYPLLNLKAGSFKTGINDVKRGQEIELSKIRIKSNS